MLPKTFLGIPKIFSKTFLVVYPGILCDVTCLSGVPKNFLWCYPRIFWGHPRIFWGHPRIFCCHPRILWGHPRIFCCHPRIFWDTQEFFLSPKNFLGYPKYNININWCTVDIDRLLIFVYSKNLFLYIYTYVDIGFSQTAVLQPRFLQWPFWCR